MIKVCQDVVGIENLEDHPWMTLNGAFQKRLPNMQPIPHLGKDIVIQIMATHHSVQG